MVKTIEAQVINSREDLGKCKVGEIIYIEGRIEFIVEPNSPYLESKTEDYQVYTISKLKEEGWFIQHKYSLNLFNKGEPLTDKTIHNWKTHLCEIGSNKELEDTLNKIIKKMIDKNGN